MKRDNLSVFHVQEDIMMRTKDGPCVPVVTLGTLPHQRQPNVPNATLGGFRLVTSPVPVRNALPAFTTIALAARRACSVMKALLEMLQIRQSAMTAQLGTLLPPNTSPSARCALEVALAIVLASVSALPVTLDIRLQ